MVTNITTIEAEGTYWVNITMDGHGLAPHGPFANGDTAEAVAAQLSAICRAVLRQPVKIGGVRQPAKKP